MDKRDPYLDFQQEIFDQIDELEQKEGKKWWEDFVDLDLGKMEQKERKKFCEDFVELGKKAGVDVIGEFVIRKKSLIEVLHMVSRKIEEMEQSKASSS